MERLRNCLSQKFRQTLAHQTYHRYYFYSLSPDHRQKDRLGGGPPFPQIHNRRNFQALQHWGDTPALRTGSMPTRSSCNPGASRSHHALVRRAGRNHLAMRPRPQHRFPATGDGQAIAPPLQHRSATEETGLHRYAVPNAIVGNCRDRVRSDHEPILASGLAGPVRKQQHISWGPRELRADCGELLQADAHTAIAAMAKTITQPASRQKFKDSRSLKELRRRAQTAPPGLTTGVRPLETGFGASQKGAQ